VSALAIQLSCVYIVMLRSRRTEPRWWWR